MFGANSPAPATPFSVKDILNLTSNQSSDHLAFAMDPHILMLQAHNLDKTLFPEDMSPCMDTAVGTGYSGTFGPPHVPPPPPLGHHQAPVTSPHVRSLSHLCPPFPEADDPTYDPDHHHVSTAVHQLTNSKCCIIIVLFQIFQSDILFFTLITNGLHSTRGNYELGIKYADETAHFIIDTRPTCF